MISIVIVIVGFPNSCRPNAQNEPRAAAA